MSTDADPRLELSTIRRSYGSSTLTEDSVAPDWFDQFDAWFVEASEHPGTGEANAMQVATVDPDGRPDVRTVLARSIERRGVVFYTNYDSAKGRALEARPYASAVFFWPAQERQVRFRGPVTKVSPDETAAYFASRPRGAQIGAWTSPQSSVIADRAALEREYARAEERFADVSDIPVPPHWGGYLIEIDEIEFWQGRANRLHDRLRFRRTDEGWVRERLAP